MPASLPEDWMLYAAGILFALVLIGSLIAAVSSRRRSRSGRRGATPRLDADATGTPNDGIVSPVRARAAAERPTAQAEGPPPPVPGSAPSERIAAAPAEVEAEPAEAVSLQQLTKSVARVRTEAPRDPDRVTPEQAARAGRAHLIQSLLFVTGAQTVCLLRHAEGRYTLREIASRNVFAHSPSSKRSFLDRTALGPEGRGQVARFDVGNNLPRAALQYYKEELAVRELVSTRLTLDGDDHLLLADTVDEGGLSDARIEPLLLATAHALELAHGDASEFAPVQADAPALTPPPAAPAPAPPATDVPPVEASEDDAPRRPRRDIIADEMAQDGSFALALAHLDEEAGHPVEPTPEAEARFEASVQEVAAGHRVEQFGPLTYGVFVRDEAEAIEAWVGAAYGALNAPEGTRVSLGAALRSDEHADPDALRSDATDALEDSHRDGSPILFG